jgi:hypothetical protein
MTMRWPARVALTGAYLAHAPLVAYLGGPHVYGRRAPTKDADGAQLRRYITVPEVSEVPLGVLGAAGYTDTITSHAWTRIPASDKVSDDEVEEMVRLMNQAVAEPVPVEGFGSLRFEYESSTIMGDPDPEIAHAPVRYRATGIAQ